MIRDHLDVGRPDQVSLTFDRRVTRRTPGTFRTRVITRGVDPQLHANYKSSRIKQYFKEGKALRTETVIGDTRDFGVGRRVTADNWTALRAVGQDANRRLCDAELAAALPAPDVDTFEQVTQPSETDDGLHAPALKFGDLRVQSLLTALVGFGFTVAGFANHQLVELMGGMLDGPYTSRQATYDLRRLRRKGLIERIPHTHRYQLTSLGRRVAVLFTKTYLRILTPGLALLDPGLPQHIAQRSPLAVDWRRFDRTLHDFTQLQMIAA